MTRLGEAIGNYQIDKKKPARVSQPGAGFFCAPWRRGNYGSAVGIQAEIAPKHEVATPDANE